MSMLQLKRIPCAPHVRGGDLRGGQTVPIVMQGSNGLCPLISIANVLLLKGKLAIRPDHAEVPVAEMVQAIANCALEAEVVLDAAAAAAAASPQQHQADASVVADQLLPDNGQQQQQQQQQRELLGKLGPVVGKDGEVVVPLGEVSEEGRRALLAAHRRRQLEELISILPRLEEGLDVNVRFDSVHGFEPTAELTAFDALGIRLLHGWVADPYADSHTAAVVGPATYNRLVERVVEYRALLVDGKLPSSSSASSSSSQGAATTAATAGCSRGQRIEQMERVLTEWALIEAFLERTAGQLTPFGLARLREEVREGELCALFRNNHFSVLHKHAGRLYLLLSDEGFAHHPRAVWERLDETSGAGVLVDSWFRPLLPASEEKDRKQQQQAQEAEAEEAAAVAAAASQLQQPKEWGDAMEMADQLLVARLQQEEAARAAAAAAAAAGANETEALPPAPFEWSPAPAPQQQGAPPAAEEADCVVDDFLLVSGQVPVGDVVAAASGREEEEGAPVLYDYENDRPFTPAELEAMRAAEAAFMDAKRRQEREEKEKEEEQRRLQRQPQPQPQDEEQEGPTSRRRGARTRRAGRGGGACSVQ